MSTSPPSYAIPEDYRLSVVVPVYNEQATITEILDRVAAVPIRKEIVVVDDGSTDDTRKLLGQIEAGWDATRAGDNRLRIILQPVNQGKGAALRAGFAAVEGDVVVVQDADLEYDPAEYPVLLEPILDGRADAVYGSRFLGSPHRVLLFWHMVGNLFLTLLSNMLTNLNLTDMETGAKAFRADVIKHIPLRSQRFGFEPEVTAKLARMRARMYEVAISYSGRQYWQGKKIGVRDGFEALWTILHMALIRDRAEHHPGYAAWDRVERLYRYNRWLWQQMAPFVGERVLCLSRGAMNVTQQLLARDHVIVADPDPWYLRLLHLTFGSAQGRLEVRPQPFEEPEAYAAEELETVLCLNVLEQIEDDRAAVRSLYRVLAPGGRLVLVTPALPGLFGGIDRAVGNLRRYRLEDLRALVEESGFEVEQARYFNLPGAVAWWINSRLLRRSRVPGIQARLQDRLVSLLRLETWLSLPIGLSVFCVARKPPRR